MNPTENVYKIKSSFLQQWREGVGILWFAVKFYFLATIYSLPCVLVWKLIEMISFQDKAVAFLAWGVGFIVALINVPLAFAWAAKGTELSKR